MTLEKFITQLTNAPNSIEFKQVMELIKQHYEYSPTSSRNGPGVYNEAGTFVGNISPAVNGGEIKTQELMVGLQYKF